MGVNFASVKTLFLVMLVDVLLLSRPACEDEGGEGVRCEDCIAEERGTEEAP